MKRIVVALTLLVLVACAVLAQGPGTLKNGERPLSDEYAKQVTGRGNLGYRTETVSVAGRLWDGYASIADGHPLWCTIDIRGWDRLVAYAGVPDQFTGKTGEVTFELDGNLVTGLKLRHGEQAKLVEIPLTGAGALTVRWDGYPVLAAPKLIKGDPAPQFACQKCGQVFTAQKGLSDHINAVHGGGANPPPTGGAQPAAPATFAVDPNDLEKLAVALRKRVDAKPPVQAAMAKGFMALMTFSLIDIPSPSIAQIVAEDLSTKLINTDFQLVERGQLDKALKELKLQDSAIIDQATAQKLGQLTGCGFIMVGSVSDRGQFIVINARVLETATGKAIAAESVECRKIEIKR